MKFPFLSFTFSILIWLIIIAAFSFNFSKDEINKTSIEVDASIIDEVSKQIKSERKIVEKSNEDSVKKTEQKENSLAKNADKAAIVARPLPEIPQELRQEAFNSFAIARFDIKKDGSFSVELIKPCNNPRLNQLLLKSLKKWQFAESKQDHIQDIRVNFKVE